MHRPVLSADDFRRLKALIRSARASKWWWTYIHELERKLRKGWRV